MATQSEQVLENQLIFQLESLKYERVSISDEDALLNNLKNQLEKHNKTTFSNNEFKRITNHLQKGTVFDKAKTLRDEFALQRDDGTITRIEFLDSKNWCQNLFQVSNQITIEGSYKNRYDVTLLINGLPLVQIELKRRGCELKQAFNQINRYQRHSFGSNSALFNYVQIFVISNGVNTKYYANNKKQSFKQTFFWADKHNKNIKDLTSFADTFLEPCHISKMICRYIVLAELPKILMVLRPYQYYASEAIYNRIKDTNKNGYIWHTTGSGKTLTSFKASQILVSLPEVAKVIFVVDRKDLDYQTTKEFNSFSNGSVDGTDNTKALVKQFGDDTKLIVTTIQKLNNAISRESHLNKMESLKEQKIVFIFDECHRSQFGQTHLNISRFFSKAQMIGFTGTPIFEQNAVGNSLGKRTTAELFDEMLHKYVITDAISDDNVLKFSVEYIGKYVERENSDNNIDIEVDNIDKQELLESDSRLEKITDYIIANHQRKTHNGEFSAIFAVSSIDTLTKYYDLFKAKKHNLKIATIFSYNSNEDDADATGIFGIEEEDETTTSLHSRDKLETYIKDYNSMFGTNFTTRDSTSFYNYYNDISRKVKFKEIDILLVVNMFLTGFDSPLLNTLYVDKNLKYHGLIQAFSRTNRIVDEKKSHGNIVCFRNLKKNTDEAIALFSNKNAKDVILMEPYEEYIKKFNDAHIELLKIAPTVSSVDDLLDENDQLKFIGAFREVMKFKNILSGFADFDPSHISMDEQRFEEFKSKYLDLYDRVKHFNSQEIVSILQDVDFMLELIHRDEINVSYILNLLKQYVDVGENKKSDFKERITQIIDGEESLRSKRELILEFIESQLEGVEPDEVDEKFEKYWEEKKENELIEICSLEKIEEKATNLVIENYLYELREPLDSEIEMTLTEEYGLVERVEIVTRVKRKILEYINKFYDF